MGCFLHLTVSLLSHVYLLRNLILFYFHNMNRTNDKKWYFKKFHENTENSSEIVILRRIFQLGLKSLTSPLTTMHALGINWSPHKYWQVLLPILALWFISKTVYSYILKNLHIFLKEAIRFCLRSSGLWVLFCRYVRAGTELTWDYNYEVGSVAGKVLYCYCGSSECRGRLL